MGNKGCYVIKAYIEKRHLAEDNAAFEISMDDVIHDGFILVLRFSFPQNPDF